MKNTDSKLGIIGGSGLYSIEGLIHPKWIKIKTPFGQPSASYFLGKLFDREVVFLPRHGVNHQFLPSEVNYRANIYGFKKLGVNQIISVSAVGSLSNKYKPMDIVLPDQIVDYTHGIRKNTFFGNGLAAHISWAQPVCLNMHKKISQICKNLKMPFYKKGAYLTVEGPAFSSRAESLLYQRWGMDIIGMTNGTEAKLAREAEICYASIALVTDYDSWHQTKEPVTTEMVINCLKKNTHNGKKIIQRFCQTSLKDISCSCQDSLKYALITHKDKISKATLKSVKLLVQKYF